jgi:flavin-binding protein dodecin
VPGLPLGEKRSRSAVSGFDGRREVMGGAQAAPWPVSAPFPIRLSVTLAERRGCRWAKMLSVTVQKAIDLSGSGETIQDAVSEALDRARESLEGITGFEVQRISGVVEGSSTSYQVELKVWFTLLERLHG